MKAIRRFLLIVIPVLCLILSPCVFAEIVAREGKGYLEKIDGQLVLHLKGTYTEIGFQHGKLLKDMVKTNLMNIVDNQTEQGKTEEYQMYKTLRGGMHERLLPFIPEKYIQELKGLADGAGLKYEDVLAGNLFPEAFHCSGIALFGKATKDGELYHVRVLDYMTDAGLQNSAVVMIVEPDGANAFMNISYAGSIGSITGMNEKQITIGEMGGKGQGFWDGMPMPLLIRETLEKATTFEDAQKIFKDTKRTCEYYYVISDAKSKKACGVYATAKQIHFINPGESYGFMDPPEVPRSDSGEKKSAIKGFTIQSSPMQTLILSADKKVLSFLNTPPEDSVVISGVDRYKFFAGRLKEKYGQVDAQLLQEMIKRPVAMKSNLHDAIFHPATLEAWVANAGPKGEPACDQPYYHYVLKKQ